MKLAVVALASLALVVPVSAQQQPPVFRSGTNIVTLDVTVVDKNGKPIKGLKASDFEVKLEGQVRPVQAVNFIEVGSGSSGVSTPTTGTTRPADSSARQRRVVVFLYDDLSIKPGASKGLTVAAERTLAQFGPDDLVGVAVTSGLVKSVNPTTDRSAVTAALSKLTGKADHNPTAPFFLTANEASEIERDFPRDAGVEAVSRECKILDLGPGCDSLVRSVGRSYARDLRNRVASQMEAYKQIIAALAAFNGAKVIITLSDGVATMSDLGMLQKQLDPIMRSAAETGVRFYAMNEDTDFADAGDITGARAKARVIESRLLYDGLASVAGAAGGEAFHVIGQADRFFTRIEAETSAIYRLGIDGPAGIDKARFLNAKVSVKTPGATVRANTKALFADAPKEIVSVDKQLMNAVANGFVDVAVPVTIATVLRRDARSAQLQLGVNLQIPDDVAGPVMTMFSLTDSAGKAIPGAAGRKELSKPATGQDYRFSFSLPLAAAGGYSLRVSAADANGRVGSTEQRINAEFSKVGIFSASSMLIGWSAADGVQKLLALDTLPPDAASMQVSIELYPDDAASMATDIAVRFSLTKIGEAKAAVEKEVRPSATGMVLSSAIDLDVKALSPGSYTIKATVLQSGKEIGAVMGLVRKR